MPAGDAVAAFDREVDKALETVRGPVADAVFHSLSIAGDHSLAWQVAGVTRALRRGSDLQDAARFAAAIGIESLFTNVVVKSLFGRLRPANPHDLPLPPGMHRPITSSFPSGHATSAFCAATLLSQGTTHKWRWYALASLVATSRVYVRLHHASDVVAGAALGVGLGIVLRPLVGE